jgi:hypothetical protein
MKTDLRLARFLKVLLDILYGGLVIGCGLLVLWILLYPALSKNGLFGTASVEVGIGSGSEPQLGVSLSNSPKVVIRDALVEGASGTLRFETNSWILVIISNTAKLIMAIGLTYFFYLLRSVMKDIIDGNPFGQENSLRIRRMGYLVLILGFMFPTIEYIAANEILNQLPVLSPALIPPSPFRAEIILASLLILILAQVWSYGLALERDQALTI